MIPTREIRGSRNYYTIEKYPTIKIINQNKDQHPLYDPHLFWPRNLPVLPDHKALS
jgi:hypothetical protein